jgi:hypothetical protein
MPGDDPTADSRCAVALENGCVAGFMHYFDHAIYYPLPVK